LTNIILYLCFNMIQIQHITYYYAIVINNLQYAKSKYLKTSYLSNIISLFNILTIHNLLSIFSPQHFVQNLFKVILHIQLFYNSVYRSPKKKKKLSNHMFISCKRMVLLAFFTNTFHNNVTMLRKERIEKEIMYD
jgi:hypothetical protein